MRKQRIPAGIGSVSLALATAAAAGLGLPRVLWVATLAVALALGALALVEQVLEPRRRRAESTARLEQDERVREALEHLEYRHLTGSLTVAWLFDVFREQPADEGLQRAQGIIGTWAAEITDSLAIAAPHKSFTFINDPGGPPPSYSGLNHHQAVLVGILERQLARLASIIEEANAELRSKGSWDVAAVSPSA